MKYLLFIFILFLFRLNAQSQEIVTNTQLALIYFQNKNFDKASVFYKELFEESNSKVYFDYYIKCMVELGDFKSAEEIIKKQIKKRNNPIVYTIELGSLYKLENKPDKAKEQFESVIKKLPDDQNEIILIANTFIVKSELEWAEKTYLQAKKNLREYFTLSFELAGVYFYQKNFNRMIDEYLALLDESEGYIQSVQNRLQNQIYDNPENGIVETLKTNLLKKIQKNADRTIYSELLIWLYIQEHDFEPAFQQSKALDKRNKENGERLMTLGNIVLTNQNYDIAVNCFKYVIDKGHAGDYYIPATNEYLNVLYQKIVNNSDYTKKDLSDLESTFISSLKELGENSNTFMLVKNLAHIQAFYLDKTDIAISMLENNLNSKVLKQSQEAECKTELADILLFTGDPWQATLYYAQVEKANKDMPVGHEAKFRKARLAYYTGDFRWANAQLNALRASTSKLIANDAMYLSLLISENTDLEFDTMNIALQLFSNADFLLYRNKDSLALITLDSIIQKFSGHPLADDILYKKYEIMYKEKKYTLAAGFLQKIIDQYQTEMLADRALFMLADLNEKKLNDNEKAKELYKTIMTKYPGSLYSADARKRYRKLRGDAID